METMHVGGLPSKGFVFGGFAIGALEAWPSEAWLEAWPSGAWLRAWLKAWLKAWQMEAWLFTKPVGLQFWYHLVKLWVDQPTQGVPFCPDFLTPSFL